MPPFAPQEIIDNCILYRKAPNREVWFAADLTVSPPRPCIVKFSMPREDRIPVWEKIARFLTESGDIPVVRAYRYGQCAGYRYLVLQYASGGTLRGLLRRRRTLPFLNTVWVCRKLLESLRAVHEARLAHLDVKPENIWIDGQRILLGDFHVARDLDSREKRLEIFGTPCYMSPEQTGNSASADERSDLFSLGSVIYELLSGEKRYPGCVSLADAAAAIGGDRKPFPANTLRQFAPETFVEWLRRLTEKDPGLRYRNAGAALKELDALGFPDAEPSLN